MVISCEGVGCHRVLGGARGGETERPPPSERVNKSDQSESKPPVDTFLAPSARIESGEGGRGLRRQGAAWPPPASLDQPPFPRHVPLRFSNSSNCRGRGWGGGRSGRTSVPGVVQSPPRAACPGARASVRQQWSHGVHERARRCPLALRSLAPHLRAVQVRRARTSSRPSTCGLGRCVLRERQCKCRPYDSFDAPFLDPNAPPRGRSMECPYSVEGWRHAWFACGARVRGSTRRRKSAPTTPSGPSEYGRGRC